MANTLILEGDGGSLMIELAVNDLGWSLCYMLAEECVYLGAWGADRILSNLQDVVQDEAYGWPPVGTLCGYPVRCAFLLSEAHHALYYAEAGADRLLFWQDAKQEPVTLVGTIRLSPEQRRKWQAQIQTALDDVAGGPVRQAAVARA